MVIVAKTSMPDYGLLMSGLSSHSGVVRESLMSRAGRRGFAVVPERPLRDRLAELAREIDALPVKVPADSRTAEAVLGYDDRGQW